MQNNFTQKWVRVMLKPGIFIDLKSAALGIIGIDSCTDFFHKTIACFFPGQEVGA